MFLWDLDLLFYKLELYVMNNNVQMAGSGKYVFFIKLSNQVCAKYESLKKWVHNKNGTNDIDR